MLTDDLYSAISSMAESINNMMDSQEQTTSDTVGSLCDSIDKLCKTVSDGKSTSGAETILGLIAGALSGDSEKIEQGASKLSGSINAVADTLSDIGKVSNEIVTSSQNISTSMQSLSEGIESIGLRTMVSAYIAKVAFPAINIFVVNAVNMLSQIADKEKELNNARKGVTSLKDSITDVEHAALAATIAGLASITGTLALVPMAAFITATGLVFKLVGVLFEPKKYKENADAISSMAKGIIGLSLAAISVTLAAPAFLLGTAALLPMSVFVVGVYAIGELVEHLFGDKKHKNTADAIHNMAKGILYMSVAALATIVTAPVALLALPCLLVVGLFTLAVGALVVKPVNSLVGSKEFKNFKSGIASMALGILLMGVTALTAIVATPILLVGSIAMVAAYAFVKASGKVFKAASKNSKDYMMGTLGLVVMSAGILATSFLLYKASQLGKDMLDEGGGGPLLILFGAITAIAVGGSKVFSIAGKALSQVVQGSVAVLLVAGTVFAAAYLFNQAVQNSKALLESGGEGEFPPAVSGLLALCGAVTAMGAAIAAAGFALPFIIPGAAAVTLVSGTVFAAAMAMKMACEAWKASQASGTFEIDSDGSTPFSRSVSGIVSSMSNALDDVDDIDKLKDGIEAILPLSDFIQRLAVGVSEFSKIALMKGEIADSTGKKMPFNLTKVGEGIGAVLKSIIKGTGDAIKSFGFEESNMIEIESGGFLGFGKKKTKIPKTIAALQHLMPLASFVSGLAVGVSEFSKLATKKGNITTVEGGKTVTRPFNLVDVGTGISSVMQTLMNGVVKGLDAFGEFEEVEVGGFMGIGATKMKLPTKLLALQHIMPLAEFVSSTAELVSSIGKDKDGHALNGAGVGELLTGILSAFTTIDNIEDKLEDAGDGLEELIEPLEDFCKIQWKNLPTSDGVKSFTDLISYISKIDDATGKNLNKSALSITKLAASLSSKNSIFGDDVEKTTDGIEHTIKAINDLDTDKADALANVYDAMAKAASKKSEALKAIVKVIQESTDALTKAFSAANSTNNTQIVQQTQQPSAPMQAPVQTQAAPAPVHEPVVPPKQKVTVDLVINGTSGDSWIIRRK